MANFVIIGSDYSGFGSKTLKIKPSSVNTSNITEKKGKLVIKVNGEVQRTISLSQAAKSSTPETPETVTLISREIALTLKEMSTNTLIDEFTEVDTNTDSQPITKSHTINKNFVCNNNNKTHYVKVVYSIQGIQTDYFSDGSNVKTYLYPEMTQVGSDQNWNISYPTKLPASIFSTYNLNIMFVLDTLPINNRLQFTFTLNDVKTPKANVSYGMTLKVQCTLVITVKNIFTPIDPDPDLKPIDPYSDDPTYDYGN